MIDTATKNRRFLGRWRKSTADTEQAINTAMVEKKPSVSHQNQQALPPRMQRDVSLMGGMFSTALGRRS
ncbi:hypothetical protein [Maritalea mediterranea]|uniref:Uncharacterized protein n=1 Tax=Maritalea mediterranea TaxID=2909667 RepID=A0ABS9E593_9HYPH|nr:hypothetical protein [Maritalea mediterranea]MCF4096960.1 hypothetical protein [Maritalea mediterranea]